jgi:hypothetical protein
MSQTDETKVAESKRPAQPIVARAGTYFRNMRYLFTVAMVGFGIYCAYDGYYAWPLHNQRVEALATLHDDARKDGIAAVQRLPKDSIIADLVYEPNGTLKPSFSDGNADQVIKSIQNSTGLGTPKDNYGLLLNQILAFVLPIGSILMLVRWLKMSTGEFRMEHDTLHAPGHPPVPLTAFTEIDDSLWDKKGIAYVDYKLPDGTEDTIKLDDFVYDRNGIDDIYALIEEAVDARAAIKD